MTETAPSHNLVEYSVSEISSALKRVVEDNFGYVRIRGEVSGAKVHSSGHCYLSLKDDKAVMNAVCWKGVVGKLPFKPEDGMEVVCLGRISTFPGKSQYQLVIEWMEPAGIGALMARFEQLKKQLAAEGLFDAARRRPIPLLPEVIGIVTSPTGAVIRDMLHRIRERFPRHVLLWPVAVQGEGAAAQIADAINGFNARTPGDGLPRPDVLIVARGGGSLEDLWAFNEEPVVRAIAASQIPVISAIGHETDTTLADFAADLRAPTPTAAAELALPVRLDLLATVRQLGLRADQAAQHYLNQRAERLAAHARLLPQVRDLVFHAGQYLDDKAERLRRALPQLIERSTQQLAVLAARFHPSVLLERTAREATQTAHLGQRLASAATVRVDRETQRLVSLSRLLDSMHYQRVLERGFALVRTSDGRVLTRSATASAEPVLQVEFYDGTLMVRADDAAAAPIPRAKPRKAAKEGTGQPDLFSAPDVDA